MTTLNQQQKLGASSDPSAPSAPSAPGAPGVPWPRGESRLWICYPLLLAAGLLLLLAFSRIHQDWWFEDDPNIVVFVRNYPKPVDHFLDREVIRALSPRRILTPMQTVSFTLDDWLAPLSPRFAYLHTGLVLLIALWLLFEVVRVYLPASAALGACLIWLYLPSTIAVIEFLSARHYLEGQMWMLISLRCAQIARTRADFGAALLVATATGCYLLAALSKELYVSSGCLCLLMIFASKRLFRVCALVLIATASYLAYRTWAIGLIGQGFESSWAFASRYHLFLARAPFIFAGNPGGYFLTLAVGALLITALIRGKVSRLAMLVGSSQALVLLATIFPVTQHLTSSFRELSSWYRIAFLWNGFLVFCGAWLVCRFASRPLKAAFFALTAIVVGFGANQALRKWDVRKADYRRDGQFYAHHPDRLLFSRLPGFYLNGIHNLYQPDRPVHFIGPETLGLAGYACLARFDRVWRRPDGGEAFAEVSAESPTPASPEAFRADPDLHSTLWRNYFDRLTPLDRPVDHIRLPTPMPDTKLGSKHGDLLDRIEIRDGRVFLPARYVEQAPWLSFPLVEAEGENEGVSLFFFLPPDDRLDFTQVALLLTNRSDSANRLTVPFQREGEKIQNGKSELSLEAGETRIVRLAGLTPKDSGESGGGFALSAISAISANLLYINRFGELRLIRAARPDEPGNLWMPHIPNNPRDWVAGLLFHNFDDDSAQVTLTWIASVTSREETQTLVVRPGRTHYLSFSSDKLRKHRPAAVRIENPSRSVAVRQYLSPRDQPNGAIATLTRAATSFVLATPDVSTGETPPANLDFLMLGLILFNPSQTTPANIQIRDAWGIAKTRIQLQPRAKRILTWQELSRESRAVSLESDIPLQAEQLNQTPWLQLSLITLKAQNQ